MGDNDETYAFNLSKGMLGEIHKIVLSLNSNKHGYLPKSIFHKTYFR